MVFHPEVVVPLAGSPGGHSCSAAQLLCWHLLLLQLAPLHGAGPYDVWQGVWEILCCLCLQSLLLLPPLLMQLARLLAGHLNRSGQLPVLLLLHPLLPVTLPVLHLLQRDCWVLVEGSC